MSSMMLFKDKERQIAVRLTPRARIRLAGVVEGNDPETGELRGRDISSPQADLILDATINSPKSFSVAALLDSELADAYESLRFGSLERAPALEWTSRSSIVRRSRRRSIS